MAERPPLDSFYQSRPPLDSFFQEPSDAPATQLPAQAADFGKSAVSGFAESVLGLPTVHADLGALGGRIYNKLFGRSEPAIPDQMRLEEGHNAAFDPAVQARIRGDAVQPVGLSTDLLKGAVENLTGQKFHEPEGVAGEYGKTTGGFLLAAAGGPAGIARRIATQAILPGTVSETAGQATKGTPYEIPARIAGSFVSPSGVTRAAVREAPSLQELKAQRDALYKTADKSDLVISKEGVQRLTGEIKHAVTEAGVDTGLHPRAMAAFRRLEQGAEENQSLKGMELIRRVASNATQTLQKDDARIARIVRDKIDDYLESLPQKDIIIGKNVDEGIAALGEARQVHQRLRKGEDIERLIEKAGNRAAQFSGSGLENALRTEFRNLAQNQAKLNRFAPAERKAIEAVNKGGPISNTFRLFGKLAPTSVVSAGLGGGIGYGLGDQEGAAGALIGGGISRGIAKAMTKDRARIASALVRRGGPATTHLPAVQSSYLARLLAGESTSNNR